MTGVVLAVSSFLAAVAAAGILRPFGASKVRATESPTDPLEDERRSLLRSLEDLDEDRASGLIDSESYRGLRGETEHRAVAVLRALAARDGSEDAIADLRALRATPSANGDGASAPRAADRRRVVAGVLIGVLVLGGAIPILAASLRNRSADQPITGTIPGDALSFFRQRVTDHPGDVAARLDLADAYLQGGDAQSAIAQYLAALKLDPRNPEAHAKLAFILYQAGRPEDGLKAVEQALAVDPTYPEALYDKGIILLRGLHRPVDAAQAFKGYLDAAPFGSHRAEVEKLLQEALG